MEKSNILKSIINGSLSGEYVVGSDEWLCLQTRNVFSGHMAADAIKEQCRKANADNPAAAYKDRMLIAGLWPVWRTKDGKEKAVGVVKGKADILALSGIEGDKAKAAGHYQWRILCAYEVLRVTVASERSVQKHIEEHSATTVDDTTGQTEQATQTTEQAEKSVQVLPALSGENVQGALGILNRLVATMALDESASDYLPFIQQAIACLKAE